MGIISSDFPGTSKRQHNNSRAPDVVFHTPELVLGTARGPKLPPIALGMTGDHRRMVRNLFGYKIAANVFKRFA